MKLNFPYGPRITVPTITVVVPHVGEPARGLTPGDVELVAFVAQVFDLR
jgi:hypothetical protein